MTSRTNTIIGCMVAIAAGIFNPLWGLLVAAFVVIYVLMKILEIVEGIQHKTLELPLTGHQINTIVQTSRNYCHESETLKLYPHNQASYPLIILDGEPYLQSRLFHNHITVNENEYSFEFPGQNPITLECASGYYEGVDMFYLKEMDRRFVRVKKLGIQMKILNDTMVWG